jgi:multiple sugar transport system permease protein
MGTTADGDRGGDYGVLRSRGKTVDMIGWKGAWHPAAAERLRLDFLPYAFIAPITLLLAAISLYPSVYAVWLAMTNANLLRLARARFIGLGNFARTLGDPIFLDSLWRTLRWDVVVVLGELVIALPIALLLNLAFRGRGLVRAAMLIPYIMPPAVVALMFVYIFDGNFGVANDILVRLGVVEQPISWLSEPGASFLVIAGAMIWSGQPLMAVILLASLQTIPKDLYEAAVVDGATPFQRFRYVTLPHLMPTILFLVLLRMIWMSNHIDMIFIMTRGGPGFANYTEAVYSFMLTSQFEIGYSSSVAVTLAVVLMTASAFYVRHLARKVLV